MDVIPNTAYLTSPDASTHASNTVNVTILPGQLPATGERDNTQFLFMLLGGALLALAVGLGGFRWIRRRGTVAA